MVEPAINVARPRARDLGIAPGQLPTGRHNAITDVPGVMVGHCTLREGDEIRTGVTAVLPHTGNLFEERVPAGLFVANGFGKLMGATQLQELGELETPILLTNTLSVPEVASGVIDWMLALPGNDDVRSLNPVVGETNDGVLNDIRARFVQPAHAHEALRSATAGNVAEGCVGAGTGTIAFGLKAGIGSSSRVVDGVTVGVLVQANFGGDLRVDGRPVGARVRAWLAAKKRDTLPANHDGSIMIVIATDAPLDDRNLQRLALRSMAGLARTGASFSHGSGDYAIAFSTAQLVRRRDRGRVPIAAAAWPNERLTPLSVAVADATEEAILNALCGAVDTVGAGGRVAYALPLELLA